VALVTGVTQRSYRKTASYCNRSRWQALGGTPWTTLRDGAEREGGKVLQFLEKQSREVLTAHHFAEDGTPQAHCPVVREVEQVPPATLPTEAVNQALA
jgi:hypothetical protein